MKTTFAAVRKLGVLVPNGEDAREKFAAIKDGAEVLIEVRTVRSVKQLRLYWAIMAMLADNCDTFADKDDASDNIKIDCGAVDLFVHHASGVVFGRPRSIAFESMPADRFNRFLERALWIIESRYLPGTSAEFRRKVHEIMDGEDAIGMRMEDAA